MPMTIKIRPGASIQIGDDVLITFSRGTSGSPAGGKLYARVTAPRDVQIKASTPQVDTTNQHMG